MEVFLLSQIFEINFERILSGLFFVGVALLFGFELYFSSRFVLSGRRSILIERNSSLFELLKRERRIYVLEICFFVIKLRLNGFLLTFVSINLFIEGRMSLIGRFGGFLLLKFVLGKLENKVRGINEMKLFGMLIG